MDHMSVLRSVRSLSRLQHEDPAWALLRTQNADITAAILHHHLGGETRKLPAPVLFEQVEADLEMLRAEGYHLPETKTAQSYCADWRTKGFLVRRAAEDSPDETLELSPAALDAFKFLNQIQSPQHSITESRLATVQQRLRQIAIETDPDVASRISALESERDRIQADIDALHRGEMDTPSPERALEQLLDVLALVAEIPSDFAKVHEDFEQLNRDLRENLIDQDTSRAAVLENIFRGVDLLAESDAGRSFYSFYELLLDPERSAEFNEVLDEVQQLDFIKELTPPQRRTLHKLLPTLQRRGAEINKGLSSFNRSLRRFVQSQELQRERQISQEIRAGLKEALQLADTVKPYEKTRVELQLSKAHIRSVSALQLHNPGDYDADGEVVTTRSKTISVEELVSIARQMDIDLNELRDNINYTLREQGPCSIAEVLAARPSTQGLASIVGLVVLALDYAQDLKSVETVQWDETTATVNHYVFTEEVPDG